MASPEIDVKYVAHLARLELAPEEEKQLGAQLGSILGYIEKLRELDVANVEPIAHAAPMVNVTRPDEIHPSLPHEDALRNAPKQGGGLFVVPKVVEGIFFSHAKAAKVAKVQKTAALQPLLKTMITCSTSSPFPK